MRSERGQATIEWVGLVLLASVVLGALATVVPADRRPLVRWLPLAPARLRREGRQCEDADRALARAYGGKDAELVRRYAPGIVYEPGERQLPVDFRECRARRLRAARPTTATSTSIAPTPAAGPPLFTRVVRARRAHLPPVLALLPRLELDLRWARTCRGGAARAAATSRDYPGYHDDDWEGHRCGSTATAATAVRSTSHGHWQWCKQAACRDRWGPRTGLDPGVARQPRRATSRSTAGAGRRRGGRAGGRGPRRVRYRARIPGVNLRERTTTAEGLGWCRWRRLDKRRYRALEPAVSSRPGRRRRTTDPEIPIRERQIAHLPPACRVALRATEITSTAKGRSLDDGADGPRAAGQAARGEAQAGAGAGRRRLARDPQDDDEGAQGQPAAAEPKEKKKRR